MTPSPERSHYVRKANGLNKKKIIKKKDNNKTAETTTEERGIQAREYKESVQQKFKFTTGQVDYFL